MCGLAGYYRSPSSDPTSYPDGAAALRALAHRGPDDSGSYVTPNRTLGLFHTRLAIVDLSPLAHQPMHSDDGQVVLCYNGELYNHTNLAATLRQQGYTFKGTSDTEVFLQWYRHHTSMGTKLADWLQPLNGMFAFAIWDANRQELLLARDAMGVKPLYYALDEQGITFASEIKALLALGVQPGALDAASIDRYLSFLWCPGEGTPVTNIRKLDPGFALRIHGGRVIEKMNWGQPFTYRATSKSTSATLNPTARPAQSLPKQTGSKPSSLPASIDPIPYLRQAVQRQMMADVPVGAFLSGGLDSSAIVTFARELNPDIRCYTIQMANAPAEGFANDLPYARRVAKHLMVPLEVVTIEAKGMAADLETMIWQLDEPLADPASLNVRYISELARSQGIKVLLSGSGGDDVFSGYRRHQALQFERYWAGWPRPLRKTLRTLSETLPVSSALGRRLQRAFAGADLPPNERLVHYFRWINQASLDKLYTPAMRAALGDARAEQPMPDYLTQIPADLPELDRMLALEQRFFLADHNLIYTDKMSMQAGVEVRVPFLDPDLMAFARQLPAHLKQRGREGKWILKKAMEPYLPHDVIYRPKTGFGAPLRHWLRHDLRDWLNDTLSADRMRRRGLFDPTAVQQLIQDNHDGRIDADYTLFSLICIEIWCQKFLDQYSIN